MFGTIWDLGNEMGTVRNDVHRFSHLQESIVWNSEILTKASVQKYPEDNYSSSSPPPPPSSLPPSPLSPPASTSFSDRLKIYIKNKIARKEKASLREKLRDFTTKVVEEANVAKYQRPAIKACRLEITSE